jgi:hypothetical protein
MPPEELLLQDKTVRLDLDAKSWREDRHLPFSAEMLCPQCIECEEPNEPRPEAASLTWYMF